MQILSLNTRGYDTLRNMPSLPIDNYEKILFWYHHFSKKYYSWLFKKWPQKCYFWCVCFTHPLKSCAHTNQTNEMVLFHVKKGKYLFLYWETKWGNWPKSRGKAWEPRKNRPKKKKWSAFMEEKVKLVLLILFPDFLQQYEPSLQFPITAPSLNLLFLTRGQP